MKAPQFWQTHNRMAKMLLPLSSFYAGIVQKRLTRKPSYAAKIPVICIGNVTMGGSGKTPVVDALVTLLQKKNQKPAVLLRGYGGDKGGSYWIEPGMDARDCGDEALLHAMLAPTLVSADRVSGAKLIEKNEAITHIVMDDGLQNPSLKKTISLLVVDGKNPFGNGRVFPAGPLRETADHAVRRVQGVIILGEDKFNLETHYQFLLPVFKAELKAVNGNKFTGKPVFAFAGIGNPQKFFDTLTTHDAVIIEKEAFPDHYAFEAQDIEPIIEKAQKAKAIAVTTRKDWVRLTPEQQKQVSVLDVEIQWEDEEGLLEFLSGTFK